MNITVIFSKKLLLQLLTIAKRITLFILITNSIYAVEINESLRLDSYANITGTSNSKDDTDSFNINGGIQGRYQVSENISFTGHIYFQEDINSNSLKDYEEDIKWLYADYYMGNNITLRAGKFQFPIFTASEIGTIGYSRTWTENPIQSYGAFGYDDFTGAEILKSFYYEDYDFALQLSYGKSENDLPSLDNRSTISGTTESIGGITLKSSNDWLILNVGYMRALSNVISVDARQNSESNLNVNFNMYAIETQADLDNYTFKAGFIKANLSTIFPDEQRYYASVEYNYDDITPYIYYANEKLYFKDTQSNDNITENINESKNYSLGIRYDISKNIAFKLSYTKNISTSEYSDDTEDEKKSKTFKGVINVLF